MLTEINFGLGRIVHHILDGLFGVSSDHILAE